MPSPLYSYPQHLYIHPSLIVAVLWLLKIPAFAGAGWMHGHACILTLQFIHHPPSPLPLPLPLPPPLPLSVVEARALLTLCPWCAPLREQCCKCNLRPCGSCLEDEGFRGAASFDMCLSLFFCLLFFCLLFFCLYTRCQMGLGR
jgi:hypothetical protein